MVLNIVFSGVGGQGIVVASTFFVRLPSLTAGMWQRRKFMEWLKGEVQ